MEQDDVVSRHTAGLKHLDCGFYLSQGRHAGRKDDRAAFARYFTEVRQVSDLARGDLPVIHAQPGETVDRYEIEWRAHKPDADFITILFQTGIIRQRQMNLSAHLKLTLVGSGRLLLIFSFWRERRDHQLGNRGLKFHVVGSGFFCGRYHAPRQVEITVVVDTRLGDYYCMIDSHIICC